MKSKIWAKKKKKFKTIWNSRYCNKQKQEGQELKTLTSSQMLSRLPISLAQLKAGNNSEKLKNEIK